MVRIRKSWLNRWWRSLRVPARSRAGLRGRPELELLECRLAPAVIHVSTSRDSDSKGNPNNPDTELSFRQALKISNGSLDAAGFSPKLVSGKPITDPINIIKFDKMVPGTRIVIASDHGALPVITHPVVIDGTSQTGLELQGTTKGRLALPNK
jgi:hypothetical protein